MTILRHLVSYLACHEDICVSLRWRGRNSGLFHQHGCAAEYAMEIFTDSDWASNKETRRSISCSTIFLGNCLLYSSSRTQKLVSLSSAEAEVYACSSGASDGLLLAGIISWMKQEREMAEQEQTVATQAGNELTAESGNVQANILNETTRTSTTPHQAPDDDEPPHDNEPQQNKGKATHKQQGQNLPADRQLWSSWHTSKTGSRAR